MAVPVGAVAAAAQGNQVALQRLQLLQADAHVAQVLVQRVAGRVVGTCGRAVQCQQGAHLVQRHVHRPAQADEAQLVDVGIAVQAVAAFAARAGRKQGLFLVVADVGGRDARALGGLADA